MVSRFKQISKILSLDDDSAGANDAETKRGLITRVGEIMNDLGKAVQDLKNA